jgi:hypothetical protein
MKTQKFYQICDRIRPDTNGCHNWPGVRGKVIPGKYCVIIVDGCRAGAHVFALERRLGRKLKKGKISCHTCDNPSCVNQSHLFEGTHFSNNQEKIMRGRENQLNRK